MATDKDWEPTIEDNVRDEVTLLMPRIVEMDKEALNFAYLDRSHAQSAVVLALAWLANNRGR